MGDDLRHDTRCYYALRCTRYLDRYGCIGLRSGAVSRSIFDGLGDSCRIVWRGNFGYRDNSDWRRREPKFAGLQGKLAQRRSDDHAAGVISRRVADY